MKKKNQKKRNKRKKIKDDKSLGELLHFQNSFRTPTMLLAAFYAGKTINF